VRSELESKRNEIVDLNKQLADRLEDLGRAKSDLEDTKKTCRVLFILNIIIIMILTIRILLSAIEAL